MKQIGSYLTQKLIECHQFQKSSNDCGPFCAAIIINAIKDIHITGNELAKLMNLPFFKGIFPIIRRIPNWATFPWGITNVFMQFGIMSDWKICATRPQLFESILHGEIPIVIIGNYRPLWSHFLIITSHEPEKGWGVIDSAKENPEITWLSDKYFYQKWTNFGRIMIRVQH